MHEFSKWSEFVTINIKIKLYYENCFNVTVGASITIPVFGCPKSKSNQLLNEISALNGILYNAWCASNRHATFTVDDITQQRFYHKVINCWCWYCYNYSYHNVKKQKCLNIIMTGMGHIAWVISCSKLTWQLLFHKKF